MTTLYTPTGLAARVIDKSTINLSWNKHADAGTILIYRKVSGGTYALLHTVFGSDDTYSDASCAEGTLYYYKIKAALMVTGPGGGMVYSEFSVEVSAGSVPTTLPAPTNLAGVANSTSQITLTWEDKSTNETGFEVWMLTAGADYALQATTAANVETYVKTGLAVSTPYYFEVRAVNATTQSQWSNVVCVTTNDPTVPVTLSNTGHQNVELIDTVSAVIDNPDIDVVTSDVLTRMFEIIATDSGTHKVDGTHSDNGYPISSYIRTKDLDFTDQYPDLAGANKTVKKFRLLYEDVDATTPVTVYISNDGGANWGTSVATLGTGDGTTKYADFYFMDSEYVTGLNFVFKVESLSTTKSFVWLAFEVEFMARGESFNV